MSSVKANHFLARCLGGLASPTEIDDYVQRWHESAASEEIHEFLGMSEEEYGLWLRDPETLRSIIAARRQNIPLASFMREEYRARNESTSGAGDARLREWLERRGELEPVDPE